MLLADQRKPLAPREFFMDGEVVMLRDFPDVFGLVMENSGENRNSTVLQHTIEFREERKDDICREISHQQMHGVLSNGRCRSEEHTSELQSPYDLVCRLLLEKKKKNKQTKTNTQKIIQKEIE